MPESCEECSRIVEPAQYLLAYRLPLPLYCSSLSGSTFSRAVWLWAFSLRSSISGETRQLSQNCRMLDKGDVLILVSFSQHRKFRVYQGWKTGVVSLGLGQPINFPSRRSNVQTLCCSLVIYPFCYCCAISDSEVGNMQWRKDNSPRSGKYSHSKA